jgi:hypothetical protein
MDYKAGNHPNKTKHRIRRKMTLDDATCPLPASRKQPLNGGTLNKPLKKTLNKTLNKPMNKTMNKTMKKTMNKPMNGRSSLNTLWHNDPIQAGARLNNAIRP